VALVERVEDAGGRGGRHGAAHSLKAKGLVKFPDPAEPYIDREEVFRLAFEGRARRGEGT
jgi:hypothetical protein